MAKLINGTCRDCAHWAQNEMAPMNGGACTAPAMRARSGPLTDGIDCGDEDEPYTGPDFGCIHWTAKP